MEVVNKNYKVAQDFSYEGDDWWTWSIWIECTPKDLENIDHVIYTLHPTFSNPVRKVSDRKSKFRLEAAGWGVFMIYAKVMLKNKEMIPLEHELELEYPDGTKNLE